jgi:hypothetical protein
MICTARGVSAADTVAYSSRLGSDHGRATAQRSQTKEKSMRKPILTVATAALLAGCAGGPMYMAKSTPNPYHSVTGDPNDWSRPYYNDRYWPPVDLNSSFPPQMMDGGSVD